MTSERAFSVPTAIAQGKSSNIVSNLELGVIAAIVSGKKLYPLNNGELQIPLCFINSKLAVRHNRVFIKNFEATD